jgi:hypothetical protein
MKNKTLQVLVIYNSVLKHAVFATVSLSLFMKHNLSTGKYRNVLGFYYLCTLNIRDVVTGWAIIMRYYSLSDPKLSIKRTYQELVSLLIMDNFFSAYIL